MENRLLGVDPAAPAWEEITPASGMLAIRLWNLDTKARPNFDWPGGTLLLHMLDAERIRVEWFTGHGDEGGFTSAARVYTR